MAISPKETNLLTEMEKNILLSCEEQIDELVRQKWESGVVCGYPLQPHWRDEMIEVLVNKYRAVGWIVTYDSTKHMICLTA